LGDAVNVGQWIRQAAAELETSQVFFGHGTDNPEDEAAWLVLHAVNAPVDGSFRDWDRPLDKEEVARVRSLLTARISEGLPLAYLIGSAWFAGMEFEVNQSVLVPRSPIAELIQDQFQPWAGSTEIRTVLDLCTGTGCIGIAIAHYMPGVRVDAVDISTEALEVAQRNVRKHGLEGRVTVYQSDLFAALGDRTYDLIVTNPPYVASSSLQDLPREYRAEPELGLVSGPDGLDACLQIMVQSSRHLNEGGMLVCEVGESESRLAGALPAVPFVWLEFSHGGSGVFILGCEELLQCEEEIRNLIKERAHVT